MHNLKNPIFLRHKGVVVRRCWNDNCNDILAEDLFTTDENPHARTCADGAFNVRELPTFEAQPDTAAGRRLALRQAIDKKLPPFND